jgi:hypothetical protein
MKLTIADHLKQFLRVMQGALFPALQEESGPLTEKHRQLVALLNMVHIEALIASVRGAFAALNASNFCAGVSGAASAAAPWAGLQKIGAR